MKLAFRSSLLLLFGKLLAHAQMSSFKHVIVIVQENRTPDNLFQGLCRPPFGTSESCSTTPNATQYNIQTSNWLEKHSPTGVTQPLPVPLGNTYDLGHSHGAFNSLCRPPCYDGSNRLLRSGPATPALPACECSQGRNLFPE